MRITSLALSAVILAVTLAPVHADKITTDPNKASSLLPAQSARPKGDERLAQRVTYISTNKRLHTVLEELSQQTGVDVQAGKDAADWQVRDLPLLICARDLPLAKLLRTIADTTHLALTSTAIQGEKHFRIWRDGKREKQLADYFAGKSEARLGKASLEWDALLKLNQTPDSQMKRLDSDGEDPTAVPTAQDLAKAFAALPAGSKDQVFSGKTVRIKAKNATGQLAEALRSLSHDMWQYHQNVDAQIAANSSDDAASGDSDHAPSASTSEWSDTAVNQMELIIELSKDDDQELTCCLYSPLGGRPEAGGSIPCNTAADLLGIGQDSPAEPEPPETEYAPSLRKLDLDNYDGLGLDKKIRLEMVEGDTLPLSADIISDISKASGWSIICEDFLSHRERHALMTMDLYGHEVTLKDALNALQLYGPLSWRIDTGRKLLVASGTQWWDDHVNLVPESLVAGLIGKMNGDGVGVDDAAETMLLTEGQRHEWISGHKELALEWDMPARFEPFWKLYARLSAEDKALAKSDEGLPLASLDRQSVIAMFAQCKQTADEEGIEGSSEAMMALRMLYPGIEDRVEAWGMEHYPQLADPSPEADQGSLDLDEVMAAMYERFPEIKAALTIPTVPEEIMKLRMRLRKVKPEADDDAFEDMRMPASLQPHRYVMTIDGGATSMLAGSLDLGFPVFSEKRKEHLMKEMLEKQKNNVTGSEPGKSKQ